MAKEDFMGGPDEEAAAGIINELEGKPAGETEMVATEKTLTIPTSIAPDLAEANQGESIEFHISATVTGKDKNGVTLDVKRAMRMPANAPQVAGKSGAESLDVSAAST